MFLPEYIYIALIVLLFAMLTFVSLKLYRFSILLLNLENSLEESLDILNFHYGKMNKILEKPIFFDSVEIRQVVGDIRSCHNAVLLIANKLTSYSGFEIETEEKNSEAQQDS